MWMRLAELGHELKVLAPAEVRSAEWTEARPSLWPPTSLLFAMVAFHPPAQAIRFCMVCSGGRAKIPSRSDLYLVTAIGRARTGARLSCCAGDARERNRSLGAWWLGRFWSARTGQRLLVTTHALRKALEPIHWHCTSPMITYKWHPTASTWNDIQTCARLHKLAMN